MNFSFSKLRKISASVLASGMLACSGGSVVNGLGLNSINTFFWGTLSVLCAAVGVTNIVAPGILASKGDSGKAAVLDTIGSLVSGCQAISSSRTTDMQNEWLAMKEKEQQRQKEYANMQALMRSYNHPMQAAALNSASQQMPMGPFVPQQQMAVMNNMQQGRYNF